ncbi:AAA family ATPase [uncultured Methanobrevibacter sp.]|uniref:AAA family ATPase n=1 Tax=uncultured Methanobrevibacter sp. TaxID=253161 RepID=UPI0025D1743B|nr:AAA family ATPase [uncultured Methanobrevibacter sp.]
MQKWLVPSNPNVYDADASFKKNGFIDWRQNKNKYEVGDIVYLYCSQTHRKIMFKSVVEKINIPASDIIEDKEFWKDLNQYNESKEYIYFRIRLIEKVDRKELSLEYLKQNGLKTAPQSPIKVNDELGEYLDKYFTLNSSKDYRIKVDYNIWSMNVSKKDSYDDAWNLFKENSCVSIDYWIHNKSLDYSSFNNVNEIKGYLKDSLPENSREPNLINIFVNDIKEGDIFIAHKGQTVVCGIGIIESEYIHQNDVLTNIRKINWIYVPDNLKIKDKYFFKTDNIVKLNEKYSYFANEILARIAGKDKSVRNKLLDFIFNQYCDDFHSTEAGQNHFSRYESGKEKIQNDWILINQKISNNENWFDDFWKNLFHRDLELFSIGGNDLKGMIQARSKKKYDFSDEDMNNLAIAFVDTVNGLLETSNNEEQKEILNDYSNDVYKSYGFQTGVMSPILFYLDESSFYPINSKAIKTVRLLSLMLDDEIKLSADLNRYIESNKEYKKFLQKLSDAVSFKLNIRIFDEFCHWICDSKLGNYADNERKVVEIFPIKEILMGKNPFKSNKKRNLIYFGAPGTGKSYNLNQDKDSLLEDFEDNYERVTFHPDYSYANFVGTFKPYPDGRDIVYKYVPGPFMRILKKAINNKDKPYLLIIEEINRANVAAVFGDVFQLLDRNENHQSIYPIDTTEDMRLYLNEDKIKLPSNLFIWATMNSADQGVFPMDTAFKRRWDFKYFSINNNENLIENTHSTINGKEVNWNTLRKQINDELLSYKINEDKLMGPFFAFNEFMNQEIPEETFKDIFKNKIIMYLFEDAARAKRNDLFSGAKTKDYVTYSEICDAFDKIGLKIFNFISDDE